MSNPDVKNVFWGKILHKESRRGGGLNGFPDPNYINEVISNCRGLGIFRTNNPLGVYCDNDDEVDKLVDGNSSVEVRPREGKAPKSTFKKTLTVGYNE